MVVFLLKNIAKGMYVTDPVFSYLVRNISVNFQILYKNHISCYGEGGSFRYIKLNPVFNYGVSDELVFTMIFPA